MPTRSILSCAAALWLSACATEAERTPEPMTVELLEPTPLDESRYRVVAEIRNFDPTAGLRGEIAIFGETSQVVMLDAVTSGRIEVTTEPLPAFIAVAATIRLTSTRPPSILQDNRSWETGPPDITAVTALVGDAGTISVTGHGLGRPVAMELGIRATPTADETWLSLVNFTCDDAGCRAVVPVLLSTDQARTFPGKVPPSTVRLVYVGEVRRDAVVGTTQLAYRITPPRPSGGTAGSTFEVSLFHPARAPDLAGVTVLFDDVALTPLAVTELGDITAGGFIYLTRAQFRVPAGAAPGVHRITARTSFDEALLSNGPDFLVVAAGQ
jgi:hypothetical protein